VNKVKRSRKHRKKAVAVDRHVTKKGGKKPIKFPDLKLVRRRTEEWRKFE